MLDFNTKKDILKRLRRKGSENIFMRVLCAVAAAFVKLWYGAVCGIGMAFSDKHGNFLGIKASKKAPAPKKRRQDDIVYVKKPFLGRVVSAVLAASFVAMFVPELGISFDAAADSGLTLDYKDPVTGQVNSYQFWRDKTPGSDLVIYNGVYQAAAYYDGVIFNDPIKSYGYARLSWEITEDYYTDYNGKQVELTQYVSGYKIIINDQSGTPLYNQSINNTNTSVKDFEVKLDYTSELNVRIYPIFRVPAWTYLQGVPDPDNPGETKDDLTPPSTNTTFAPVESTRSKVQQIGKVDAHFDAASMNVMLTDKTGVSTDEFYPDSIDDVNIVWDQPQMIRDGAVVPGEYPDGYMVYLYDYTTNRMVTKKQEIAVSAQSSPKMSRSVRTLFNNDLSYGHHYKIFVEAYKNVWGGSQTSYSVTNTGLISSSLYAVSRGNDDIYKLYQNYPDDNRNLCHDLFVAPYIEFDTIKYSKSSITVSWKKDPASTYTGVEIYRSTEDIQVNDLVNVLVTNAGNKNNAYGVEKIHEILNDKTLSYTDEKINKDTQYYYYIVPFITRTKNDTNRIRGTAARDKGSLEFNLTTVRITYTTDNGEVRLKWTPSKTINNSYGNADGYKLEIFQKKRYDPDTKEFEVISADSPKLVFSDDTFGPNDLSYNHDGLFNNEMYTYVVTPYVNVNPPSGPPKPFYGPSTSVDVTVGGLLGTPENVTAECTADGEVTIKWDKVPNATGYTVRYIDKYNGKIVEEGSFDSKSNTKVHKGLLLNHVMTYYVTAYKTVTVHYESQTTHGEESVPASVTVGNTLARPQNISATAVDGAINISWSKVPSAEGYLLQYKYIKKDGSSVDFEEDITKIKDNVFDLTDIKYTHSGLNNGDRYTYRVLAYKKISGEKVYSPWSDEVWRIVGIPLDAPKDLTATTKDGLVDLKWGAVKGAEGYYLYISKNGGAFEGPVFAGSPKYQHSGLKNGDRYEYYVEAYKTVNGEKVHGEKSNNVSITVGAPLDVPKDLTATTKDGQVDLKWTAVKGATGYYLWFSRNGSAWDSIISSKPSYQHTRLNNGDVYEYYVVAYKTVNGEPVTSDGSNHVVVTVGDELAAPKDFTGTVGDGYVDLTWSAVKGAEGYEVYYRRSGSTTFDRVFVSRTSYRHSGLNNGDSYEYYVRAFKTVNGERIYSDSAMSNHLYYTIGVDISSPPRDFTVTTSDGRADLKWSAVKGAEGYVVYASSSGRSQRFDVSGLTYSHTGLDNGSTWSYRVAAYKTVNGMRIYSQPTDTRTVSIGISLNSAVDLVATAGNRQIDLSWTAVPGAQGYVVYLYNSSSMEFEPITDTSKTRYSHIGLKNGRQYTYMVAPYKTINGKRYYGEYSMSVTAIPTVGSITDMDHTLNVRGTAPSGISHGEYISAVSNHGAFDESVDVYFTTNRESTQEIKDVLKNYADGLSSFIVYPFDISIYKEGTRIKVDPEDGFAVTVTMPVPDRLIAYRDYITVIHIGDGDGESDTDDILASDWARSKDQRLEVLPCAIVDIDNVWCVQFKCTSFSPYALVIYKEHITDISTSGGILDGDFAGTFNSGVLLFTALPDILPNNRRLKVVCGGSKRYRIKSIEKR